MSLKIKQPCIITARLLPGIKIGDSFISIEYSERKADEGRARYRYYIDTPAFEHVNDDLQSGYGGGSLQEGLDSLLSFLQSGDAFDDKQVAEWAQENSEELSMAQLELEETPDAITPAI